MDALGLQAMISTYDSTGNTEVCAFSGSVTTTALSTTGTELKRIKTKSTIALIGCLSFTHTNLYVDYESTKLDLYPNLNSTSTAILQSPIKDENGTYAHLLIYIDDDTLILEGTKIKSDSGTSARYAGLFIIFH